MTSKEQTVQTRLQELRILVNGQWVSPFRRSVSGEPRSALCAMGICEECRATVNGVPHVRTCQRIVASGMEVVAG
jgi:hypothetical protein